MSARLAVDIGGTFTDVVLETADAAHALKVLTTTDAPERGVLEGVRTILAEARCRAADVGLAVHGTTLATNALIERKGARTALLTTAGFRDVSRWATRSATSTTTWNWSCRRRWCRATCGFRCRKE